MRLNCEKSIARRLAVGLVAFAWLLLQTLTPLAVGGAASASTFGLVCSKDASSSGSPLERHQSGPCCIAACSACVCGYIESGAASGEAFERPFVSLSWVTGDGSAIASSRQAYFAARAPPISS